MADPSLVRGAGPDEIRHPELPSTVTSSHFVDFWSGRNSRVPWKIAVGRAQDFMMSLNVARLASYPVAATAVLLCAAVISLKIYQTPPSPNVARIAPIVPAQSATDGGWSLASPVSTRITVTQPRSHLSTHRTATPPRYVLDSMPVSYESSLRF